MMDGSDRYFRPGGGRTENADRDAAIYRAREIEGLTYRDIGSRFTLKDSSGLTMVADTDKRDAVPAGAAADFADVSIEP